MSRVFAHDRIEIWRSCDQWGETFWVYGCTLSGDPMDLGVPGIGLQARKRPVLDPLWREGEGHDADPVGWRRQRRDLWAG